MLTIEQQAENSKTWHHINRVQHFINKCVTELINRAEIHDQSKLGSPEVEKFTEYNSNNQLNNLTYGSPEYQENIRLLGDGLAHHYARNRHHPEWHKNGVQDMNLLDLIEMLCDWRAATERHNDGNIRKSIEKNAERFNINPQLVKIFENTADFLE